jgi:hypothetical protein
LKIASVIFWRQLASVGIRAHGTRRRSSRLRPVGQHELGVHLQLRAETGAGRAGAWGELNEKLRGSRSSMVVPS